MSERPVAERYAAGIAHVAEVKDLTVAVAESLTSGAIASALGAAPEASVWFRGGVVAYSPHVKFEVLGVSPGPVVTAECAQQMARGVRELLGADWAVAVTGAGGPGTEEGQPPGTVYFAVAGPEGVDVQHRLLHGEPGDVVAETVERALEMLLDRL
ncbi:CinA family protein [Tessaracoccus terricola]